jgi:hypothetical protein
VGLAYALGSTRATVLRAGFGMAYDALYSGVYGALGSNLAGLVSGNLSSNTPGFLQTGGILNPLPLSGTPTIQQQRALISNYYGNQQLPYSMQWNATVQQEVWHNFTAEVKYIGTRGVHLENLRQLGANQRVTAQQNLPLYFTQPTQAQLNASTVTLNSLTSLPASSLTQYGFTSPITTIDNGGNSMYHALAITLNQRFSGGFQLLGNYTWSHLIDDSTGTALDLALPTRVRDTSLLDRRHRATVTGLFEVAPLFKNTYSVVRNVFADVSVTGTYTFESPQYLPALSGADINLTNSALGSQAIFNPNGNAIGVSTGVTPLRNSAGQTVGYLANNPNAQFIAGAPGLYGAGFRNAISMGNINNFDVSAVKRFNFRDRASFELRGEAYNVFNHPQYVTGQINTIGNGPYSPTLPSYQLAGSSDFGDLRSAFTGSSRILQVALRVTF